MTKSLKIQAVRFILIKWLIQKNTLPPVIQVITIIPPWFAAHSTGQSRTWSSRLVGSPPPSCGHRTADTGSRKPRPDPARMSCHTKTFSPERGRWQGKWGVSGRSESLFSCGFGLKSVIEVFDFCKRVKCMDNLFMRLKKYSIVIWLYWIAFVLIVSLTLVMLKEKRNKKK